MASTNQSPFYQRAEQEFLNASTDEERLECLEIMIKECPKHKSSENMLKNLTSRYKKLKQGLEKRKKSQKGNTKDSIKKSEIQAMIIGETNTGKTTFFNILTKKNAKVSNLPFTTIKPQQGISFFEDARIQVIDGPPFPNEDKGLLNSADSLIVIAKDIKQIESSLEKTWKSQSEKIVILNKADLLSQNEVRKLSETLKSKFKKYKSFVFSCTKPEKIKIDKIKEEIFKSSEKIRIYTKEPKKESSKEPMLLKKNSTPKDVSEKILKGMSKNLKKIRIWGPSSKFGGQGVGLNHILKDKDIVEFQTK